VKNVQVIDGAANCVYDIFAATNKEFSVIFPPGQDVAFIDEVIKRSRGRELKQVLDRLWTRRVPRAKANGIHGILFYELEAKKAYYPTRRDEEAQMPDGGRLR
jgi:hypothetical protein